MKQKDVIWGGVLFVCGALIFVLIPGQIRNVGGSAVGPRAFPYFLSVMLMICSAGLALQSFMEGKHQAAKAPSGETGAEPGSEADAKSRREADAKSGSEAGAKPDGKLSGAPFALVFFAILLAYALAMRVIGYVIASFLFLPVMLALLGVRKKLLYLLLIPIVLVVYAVFSMLLHVQLP